jgi:hypothetical protein
MSEDRKPSRGDVVENEQCACCGFEPVRVKYFEYSNMRQRGQLMALCDLCASSMAGTEYDYRMGGEAHNTWAASMHAANAILRRLGPWPQAAALNPLLSKLDELLAAIENDEWAATGTHADQVSELLHQLREQLDEAR